MALSAGRFTVLTPVPTLFPPASSFAPLWRPNWHYSHPPPASGLLIKATKRFCGRPAGHAKQNDRQKPPSAPLLTSCRCSTLCRQVDPFYLCGCLQEKHSCHNLWCTACYRANGAPLRQVKHHDFDDGSCQHIEFLTPIVNRRPGLHICLIVVLALFSLPQGILESVSHGYRCAADMLGF